MFSLDKLKSDKALGSAASLANRSIKFAMKFAMKLRIRRTRLRSYRIARIARIRHGPGWSAQGGRVPRFGRCYSITLAELLANWRVIAKRFTVSRLQGKMLHPFSGSIKCPIFRRLVLRTQPRSAK